MAAPHSRGFTDRSTGKPLTALDEAVWMFNHAGAAGSARLLRWLKSFLPA